MGQAHIWPQIGPIRVPRPRARSMFHETDTRNLIFWRPGGIGSQNPGFGAEGGGGPVYAIVTTDFRSKHGPVRPFTTGAIFSESRVPWVSIICHAFGGNREV